MEGAFQSDARPMDKGGGRANQMPEQWTREGALQSDATDDSSAEIISITKSLVIAQFTYLIFLGTNNPLLITHISVYHVKEYEDFWRL